MPDRMPGKMAERLSDRMPEKDDRKYARIDARYRQNVTIYARQKVPDGTQESMQEQCQGGDHWKKSIQFFKLSRLSHPGCLCQMCWEICWMSPVGMPGHGPCLAIHQNSKLNSNTSENGLSMDVSLILENPIASIPSNHRIDLASSRKRTFTLHYNCL